MFCGNLKALFCGNSNCSQNILGEGLTFFFHVEKVISQSRFGGRGERGKGRVQDILFPQIKKIYIVLEEGWADFLSFPPFCNLSASLCAMFLLVTGAWCSDIMSNTEPVLYLR